MKQLTGILVELQGTGTRVPFFDLGIETVTFFSIVIIISLERTLTPEMLLTQDWHNRRLLGEAHSERGSTSSLRPSGCIGNGIRPPKKGEC